MAGYFIAGITIADLAFYAILLVGESTLGSRVFFVAGFLVLVAVLGLAAALARRTTARTFMYGFTGGAGLGLGLIGIDSIGLPLFAVCALSMVALRQVADRTSGPIIVGVATALIVIMVGLTTTT